MNEKNIQQLFGKKNRFHGVFELKLVKGVSKPFSCVADHQVKALLAVEGEGLYHKISDGWVVDSSRGKRSPMPKPFDCVYLAKTPAYVVIVFYVERKKKFGYYVRINDFLDMRAESARKSFTEPMVSEFAERTIDLR